MCPVPKAQIERSSYDTVQLVHWKSINWPEQANMERQFSPLIGTTRAYYTLARGSSAMLVTRCSPLDGWSPLHASCSRMQQVFLSSAEWGTQLSPFSFLQGHVCSAAWSCVGAAPRICKQVCRALCALNTWPAPPLSREQCYISSRQGHTTSPYLQLSFIGL